MTITHHHHHHHHYHHHHHHHHHHSQQLDFFEQFLSNVSSILNGPTPNGPIVSSTASQKSVQNSMRQTVVALSEHVSSLVLYSMMMMMMH